MENDFLNKFISLANKEDATLAKRTVGVLKKNGIQSFEDLMKANDNTIFNLPGVGERMIRIIGIVKTKETANNIAEERKKKLKVPKTFKEYAIQVGCKPIDAIMFEKILKQNGINTMKDFMELSQEDLSQINGIGAKRLQKAIEIKSLYSQTLTKRKRR